jgi:hypothetical protein
LNKILELSAINKKGDSFPIELTVVPIKTRKNFSVLSLETLHNEKYSTKNTLGNERFESNSGNK